MTQEANIFLTELLPLQVYTFPFKPSLVNKLQTLHNTIAGIVAKSMSASHMFCIQTKMYGLNRNMTKQKCLEHVKKNKKKTNNGHAYIIILYQDMYAK